MNPYEFARLAQELSDSDPQQTADQVVAHALQALGATYGGVTLVRSGGRLETVAPSEDLVVKADLLQYELREGPCFEAACEGQVQASPSLADDRRWPEWAPRAAALGIRSALAADLSPQGSAHRLGALNLYWSSPQAFTSDDLVYASIFAVHAAVALSASLSRAQLNTALDARKVIGQAQGILMERHGLSVEQSFEVLRRYSQDHNIKLREVAQQLVDTRQLPARRGGAGEASRAESVGS